MHSQLFLSKFQNQTHDSNQNTKFINIVTKIQDSNTTHWFGMRLDKDLTNTHYPS